MTFEEAQQSVLDRSDYLRIDNDGSDAVLDGCFTPEELIAIAGEMQRRKGSF